MLTAIIIDDELHCIDTLQIQLQKHCPDVVLLASCRSAKEGLECIKSMHPDIVFLDIEMPVMNGFQMLEQINKQPFSIIFTTSFDQYALKAIRFSALDYLLKPVDPMELVAAVAKVRAHAKQPLPEQFDMLFSRLQKKVSNFNKVAIPTLDGYELLNCADIVFCEADDNYTIFHMKAKKKVTATRMLREIEEQMQEFSQFARVHHSFIVNMNEVARYIRGEGGYLIMNDGSSVNVSRSRKEALLKWFQ
jgi:two-component system, LytTR family, response regulator